MWSLKFAFGQFVCSLKGGHKVSEADEQKLFDCLDAEIDTTCIRCGSPVHLEINSENEASYLLTAE